jgi:hypothetical protein
MRGIKTLGSAVTVALTLAAMVGASGASAANWDPANVTVPISGTMTLTTSTGGTAMCSLTNTFVRSAGGDLAVTTDSAGTPRGPQWTACMNGIAPILSTTITSTTGTAGAWSMTATSTTSVDLTGVNLTVALASLCTISAMNVSIASNTWSNTTHTLTFNSTATFPIVESGICDGGTTGRISGTFSFPSSAVVT